MWEYMNTNELVHHGILGQKWGVRRYQNKDGSYTNAGKERYGANSKTTESHSDIISKHLNVKKGTELSKQLLSDDEATPQTDRATKAAVTGLNAIIKTKINDPTYPYNPNNPEDQHWFLIEDQTVGYAQVADLANRGYSASKIKSLMNDASTIDHQISNVYGENEKAYDSIPFDKSGISALSEFNRVYSWGGNYKKEYNNYIDACVEYNKIKHSAIQPWSYHSPDELYHYGRLGMKWGVRLYQNKDGSLTALGKQRYGTAENLGRVMAAKQKAADFKKNKRAYEAQAKKNAKADAEIQNIKRKAGMKTKADKKSDSGQEEWTQAKKGKKISEMSNKEIQEKINRIQLEKQLKREMASIQAEKISKGKQVVNALIKVGGSQFVQNSVLNPLSKEIGKRVSEQLSGGKKEPTRSEILKKQAEDAMNEMKISNYRRTTIMNKQQIEAMRRDPNYVHAFDAADRKAVRKEDRKLNKELERTAQREKDKADLKENREKAKEKQRQQYEEYEAKQAAEAKTREKARELTKNTPTTGDDVYDRYLLKKNEEALKRYEEEERKRNRG